MTIFPRVEDPGIHMSGLSSVPEDMDSEQWLRPVCAFGGAKDSGKLATDILSALRLADKVHETVLPALRHLHVWVIAGLLGSICRPASTFCTSTHPTLRSL